MNAIQIRQKDALFYVASYPAEYLLAKVQFISRFYGDGQSIQPEPPAADDDVARFIAGVEKTDKAFQRALSKIKVKAIRNFYETAVAQPPIPGTVLLFTPEQLRFDPASAGSNMGDLHDPAENFLVIDGQHRLAALKFYDQNHPDEAKSISVPCVIFDGRSEDFASEMFVIINSTATRISKSHLVDLYERTSWTSPDRKMAAQIVGMLYSREDSPLRFRINRLGGRSHKEKWILQGELFNEIHHWVKRKWPVIERGGRHKEAPELFYGALCDFLKAASLVLEAGWNNEKFMITKPVTLKALVRVASDLCDKDGTPIEGRLVRWTQQISPWAGRLGDFQSDVFNDRFPAKGQMERVGKIHKELWAALDLRKAPAVAA